MRLSNACRVLAVAVAIALPSSAWAANQQSLDLTAGLASIFDDNILKYSSDQLSDLESGINAHRFGLSQPEDMVYRPSLTLLWRLKQAGGRERSLRVKGDGELYTTNEVANFGAARVTWRERFSGGRRLTLDYYRAPDYYQRRYFDESLASLPTTQQYQDAKVDRQRGIIAWRWGVRRSTFLELEYRLERQRYASSFRDRDSDTHQGKFSMVWERLPRSGRVRLVTGFQKKLARGGEGDVPDRDYRGFVADLGGRMDLVRAGDRRLLGDIRYAFKRRLYDSERFTDSYFKRSDWVHAVEVGLGMRSGRSWSARSFYRFETSLPRLGPTAPPDDEIVGYRVSQVGFVVEWTIRVWQRSNPGQ